MSMSDEERLAWGAKEADARMRDLSVRTAEGLRAAQANARRRAQAAGMTRTQAARAVADALRARAEGDGEGGR